MRIATIIVAAACSSALLVGSAYADCRPLGSDVVAIGQKNARGYSERSLKKAIAAEKESIITSGAKVTKVTKINMTCKPFRNLLGADEWRCVGEAKVCMKR